MTLQVFTTAQTAEWMTAIEPCQFDFYHLPQYHAVAEAFREGTALLFHYAEDGYSISLPLLIRTLDDVPGVRPEQHWQDATSVYGYAGPVASHVEIPEPVVRRFQEALAAELRSRNVVTAFSRLHPIVPQGKLLEGIGDCRVLSQTVSIDLTLSPDEQRNKYRHSLRTAINRIRRKGVTVIQDREGIYLEDFIDIYYETMRRVGAVEAYFFPRDYFRRLRRELGDRFHLGVAMFEGKPVCAGIFIEAGAILQYHLGGTLNSALDFAPMKLLVDEMRQFANARGLKYFHLGGGSNAAMDNPLLHFKRGFSELTHEFAVWRWILDPAAYERLSRERAAWNEQHGQRAISADFFPAYRTLTLPIAPPLAAVTTAGQEARP